MAKALYSAKSSVTILDDDSFIGHPYKIRAKQFKGPGVLKVYAPWCPHCVSKVECLNILATLLQDEGMQVYVLDGTENDLFCEHYGISGYPTFMHVNADRTVGQQMNAYDVPTIVQELCKVNSKVCKMHPC